MSHDNIRAALAAATPGPWHAWDRGIGYEVHVGPDCEGLGWGESECRELNSEFRETFRESDAHLIANAPTWLAELLAEVDRLSARALPDPKGGCDNSVEKRTRLVEPPEVVDLVAALRASVEAARRRREAMESDS